MQQFSLDAQTIKQILDQEMTGRFATLDADVYPYIIPVHFVEHEGCIYIHTGLKGEKLDNLARDARAGFEVDVCDAVVATELPCKTTTRYTSVVMRGTASLVTDEAEQRAMLNAIVDKYTPQHSGKELPEAAVRRTRIIAFVPISCSGVHHAETALHP